MNGIFTHGWRQTQIISSLYLSYYFELLKKKGFQFQGWLQEKQSKLDNLSDTLEKQLHYWW